MNISGFVSKDVRQLREPGAWVLLGAAALQVLSGLVHLLFSGGPFTYLALEYVSSDAFFTGVTLVGLVVLAVLFATRLGGDPTPQARMIAMGAVGVLGVVALLDVVCILAGLAAGGGESGVVLDAALSAKFAMFLYGAAKLAVLAVGGFYVFSVLQSFGPVFPSAQQHAGAGYGQYDEQAAYGQSGEQPAYGQSGEQPYGQSGEQPAYGQHGEQPYGQSGEQPAYGQHGYGAPQQQQPLYGQPQQQYPPQSYGHGQSQYGQSQYGQPGYGPPQQHAPSGPASQSPAPQPAPWSGPQPTAAPDRGEGDWTRAYGSGEAPVQDGAKPDNSSLGQSPLSDPYWRPE